MGSWMNVRSSWSWIVTKCCIPLCLRMTAILHATGSRRHSSVQTSTTSIMYFARVLTAIFALLERIPVRTPQNLL